MLILAAVVDVAMATLLIGASGFLFGTGTESMHDGAGSLVAYVAAVIACVTAPIVGFILTRRGKPAPAIIAAWVPPAGALAAMLLPPSY